MDNRKNYFTCLNEARNYTDRDAYISDLAMSTMWGDAAEAGIPADRIEKLGRIFDAYNRSVKEIAKTAGMSQRKLAERFCIPYRTMEAWCMGERIPPDYVRMMMQECLGFLPAIR